MVRNIYDALFELNVECDFIPSDAPAERLAKYEMIVTPALYCTPQETTDRLREFVSSGGHLVSTMRSFVTDDEVTVWHDRAPHNLTDVFGMTYNQFTRPNGHVSVEFAGTLPPKPRQATRRRSSNWSPHSTAPTCSPATATTRGRITPR